MTPLILASAYMLAFFAGLIAFAHRSRTVRLARVSFSCHIVAVGLAVAGALSADGPIAFLFLFLAVGSSVSALGAGRMAERRAA